MEIIMKFIEKSLSALSALADVISSVDLPKLSCDIRCKAKAFRHKDDEEPLAEGEYEKKFSFSLMWVIVGITALVSFIAGALSDD